MTAYIVQAKMRYGNYENLKGFTDREDAQNFIDSGAAIAEAERHEWGLEWRSFVIEELEICDFFDTDEYPEIYEEEEENAE